MKKVTEILRNAGLSEYWATRLPQLVVLFIAFMVLGKTLGFY